MYFAVWFDFYLWTRGPDALVISRELVQKRNISHSQTVSCKGAGTSDLTVKNRMINWMRAFLFDEFASLIYKNTSPSL